MNGRRACAAPRPRVSPHESAIDSHTRAAPPGRRDGDMKARLTKQVKGSAMILGLLLLVAAPAYAQTGYPPGPATTQPAGVNATQDLGTLAVGESADRELCGFASGSAVRLTVNGAFVLNKTADANGCVRVQFRVASETVIEVDDPIPAPAHCGANDIVATGAQTDGAPVSQTLQFEIVCGSLPRASTASTGAGIARGALVGVALVGTGVLLALGSRRRKARDPA